jgi:hypothetical protein
MILVISTESNEQFGVAVGEESIEGFRVVKKRFRQSELLLKTIYELLEKKNKKLVDLSGIVVVSGPGVFSGIRIGVTTGNALGYGLNVPVVGVEVAEHGTRNTEHEVITNNQIPIINLNRKKEGERLEKIFQEGRKKLKGKPSTPLSLRPFGKFEMKGIVVAKYGSEPNISIPKLKK